MRRSFTALPDTLEHVSRLVANRCANGRKDAPRAVVRSRTDLPAAAANGERIALRDLMIARGFADDEMALLRAAQGESDALVALEEVAMRVINGRLTDADEQRRLVGETDRDMAIRLPRVDGHEVLRRIRADRRTALLPVVILTSSDEKEDILRSYRNGANGYVCKPIKAEELFQAVQQVGLCWSLINTVPPSQED